MGTRHAVVYIYTCREDTYTHKIKINLKNLNNKEKHFEGMPHILHSSTVQCHTGRLILIECWEIVKKRYVMITILCFNYSKKNNINSKVALSVVSISFSVCRYELHKGKKLNGVHRLK